MEVTGERMTIQYIIKVYRIKNIVKKGNLRTWDLEYVSDLPYIFNQMPINICNQMNEMFRDSFEHKITMK